MGSKVHRKYPERLVRLWLAWSTVSGLSLGLQIVDSNVHRNLLERLVNGQVVISLVGGSNVELTFIIGLQRLSAAASEPVLGTALPPLRGEALLAAKMQGKHKT